ncbi:Inner membrane transport protein ynfM [Raoultella planticola]|uniref:Inner membrane transport protein ynfM n=1 Tax=Raoultella planticola TaxID=575 RepID=A0A485A7J5_RAOPL|nr:Inner membrane transport protein ynfM [Raoultella planticola]
MFWRILPESRHFRPSSLRPKTLLINLHLHWRDRGLPLLFLEGFLLMGSFVTLFNYIGYRLMMSPWSLNQAVVGPALRRLSDRHLEFPKGRER